MYEIFGISNKLENLANDVENEIKPQFEKIDKICEFNSLKVLNAMQKCNLSGMHLNTSTGYGIDEPGRDKIEEIYSDIFKSEDALVRSQFISGSHALAVTLQGLLRPGDTILSITGLPYDTLQTVIGIGNNPSPSSLKAFNIKYEQIDLLNNEFDTEKIVNRLSKNDVKLIEIQRSIGYSLRKSLTIEKKYAIFLFAFPECGRDHLSLQRDAGVAQLVEQLICNQQVGGSSPSTSSRKFHTEEFPSGQRGQTVNLLSTTSVVRIHPLPPKIPRANAGFLLLHSSLFTIH